MEEKVTSYMQQLISKINTLNGEVDGKKGIDTVIEGDGQIRNLTEKSLSHPRNDEPYQNFSESWKIIALSQISGALKLVDISDLPLDKKEESVRFFKNFENFWMDLIDDNARNLSEKENLDILMNKMQSSTGVLVDYLLNQNLSINGKAINSDELIPIEAQREKYSKALQAARDFVNFDDRPRDIVTHINFSDHNNNKYQLKWTSEPSSYLSSQLKDELNAIRDNKESEFPEWYKGANIVQKALVVKHADNILQGQIIPTQMRFMPGLRNLYLHKRELYKQSPQGAEMKLISETQEITSGTLAHNGKGNQHEITKGNIKMLQAFAEEKGFTKLTLDVLNTNFLKKAEKDIVTGINKAFREVKTEPANSEVTLEKFQAGVNKLVLPKALRQRNVKKHTEQSLNAFDSPKSSEAKQEHVIAVMCQSGKDRTQRQELLNSLAWTQREIQKVSPEFFSNSHNMINLTRALRNSGHAETIIGAVGSTRGILGAKTENILHNLLQVDRPKITNFNKIEPKFDQSLGDVWREYKVNKEQKSRELEDELTNPNNPLNKDILDLENELSQPNNPLFESASDNIVTKFNAQDRELLKEASAAFKITKKSNSLTLNPLRAHNKKKSKSEAQSR